MSNRGVEGVLAMTVTAMRREYWRANLSETEVADNPINQFQAWFEEALAADVLEPNAMTLATASLDGRPSARIVLLKEFDGRGFSFHTNYQSRKGRELDANPFAALVFFWAVMERQVRIEGHVERISEAESDAYFASRPPGSRLGTCASNQSEVIPDRETLEARLRELEQQHPGGDVTRPPHWGGYRLVPDAIEFWQGRPNRLHDRIRYRRLEDGRWLIERLSP
jgi:pyridoxamine 5'-phosphate oxidase